ncbi:Abi family protein [Glutamicibacter sp. M10]|uniref:Abi family protein n=1 Tax=Glutamicibacter sp. M10 TaxID=3023076 RepID=UPI0021C928D8|nr:Abi family protein [Glutamicibacter sp. M10]UXN32552.1 Abi family protein [Glutamicibacter sp. M10]
MTFKELKNWSSISEQIDQLRGRGLDVEWDQSEHWLRFVGYYRLSGYWHPFRVVQDDGTRSSTFVTGASMKNVAELYEFDRKLKAHLLSGLERVEVACRSRIADVLGERDVNALANPQHFRSPQLHHEMIDIVDRRISRALAAKDPVALHHRDSYDGRYPIWVAMEFLDFGDVSRLYANLMDTDREKVASWFGWVPPERHPEAKFGPAFMNWLRHLTIVRNTAAHHSRLWNRTFEPVSVKRLNMVPGLEELRGQQDKIFGTSRVLTQLLSVTSPGTTWSSQLVNLLEDSFQPLDGVSWNQLGFPANWRDHFPNI